MSARLLCVLCCACALGALAPAAAAPPAPASAAPPAPASAAAATDILDMSKLLYTADHEVTRLGAIFGENEKREQVITVLFIESDTDERGERVDYGLYALKHDVKTKLLDNAMDIAVVNLETAYFAARDGIYLYNKEKKLAQKYGSVRDNVISLAVENSTGAIYYLNRQHQLYKVTEDGNKSSIVDAVKDAEEIAVDYTGHLYYYTADKQFYVYDGHDVRKVEDIPHGMKKVWFVKTPMMLGEYGIVNGDDQFYGIRAANVSASAVGRPGLSITALSGDAGLIVYFAKDKKIYEVNFIPTLLEGMVAGVFQALKNGERALRESFSTFSAAGRPQKNIILR